MDAYNITPCNDDDDDDDYEEEEEKRQGELTRLVSSQKHLALQVLELRAALDAVQQAQLDLHPLDSSHRSTGNNRRQQLSENNKFLLERKSSRKLKAALSAKKLQVHVSAQPHAHAQPHATRKDIEDKSDDNDDADNDNDNEDGIDDIELPLLPDDTFSFFAFSNIKSSAMATALVVITVQLSTIVVLLVDMFSDGTPYNRLGVPARVSPATSIIQVLALFIGVFSQTDYQDSLNTLLVGYDEVCLRENFGPRINYWRWVLSLSMRIGVSLMGLVATFFLIISESDPTELLLDFTAIEFVTNLDNIFFWLTARGYLGLGAMHDANKVVTAKAKHMILLISEEEEEEDYNDEEEEDVVLPMDGYGHDHGANGHDGYAFDTEHPPHGRKTHSDPFFEGNPTTATTTSTTATSSSRDGAHRLGGHAHSDPQLMGTTRQLFGSANSTNRFGRQFSTNIMFGGGQSSSSSATQLGRRPFGSTTSSSSRSSQQQLPPHRPPKRTTSLLVAASKKDVLRDRSRKKKDSFHYFSTIGEQDEENNNKKEMEDEIYVDSSSSMRRRSEILETTTDGPIVVVSPGRKGGFKTVSKRRASLVVLDPTTVGGSSPAAVAAAAAGTLTRNAEFPRFGFLCFIYLSIMTAWAIFFYRQVSGYYLCQTVFVQFSDAFYPELAAFSGLYNYNTNSNERLGRGEYWDDGHGAFSKTAKFGYCKSARVWSFVYGESPTNIPDVCDWTAKSIEINPMTARSYDIMSAANEVWSVRNARGSIVPLPTFTMLCFDCTNDPDFCGGEGRGECVSNRCKCNPGFYGQRCEFFAPCDRLEVNPLYDGFRGNRKWPEAYSLVRTEDGEPVEVYGRTVYQDAESAGRDLIFFNGRRWVIGTSSAFPEERKNFGAVFSKSFHAHWSNYTVGFLSSEIGVDTPADFNTPVGEMSWFLTSALAGAGDRSTPTLNRAVDANFLCAGCSNSSNPCSFDGFCQVDGSCLCTTGSTGTLCQIPPVGNTFCDKFFNTPEFSYDGGDCCEETCTRTGIDSCGKGLIGSSSGVDALEFIGYPFCSDPQFTSKIEGSRTLFDILERGFVQCGTSFQLGMAVFQNDTWKGFEVDLCKAIAGAIFGNPEAFEIVLTDSSNRFQDLLDKKYDVVIRRTTHNAERDVNEQGTNSGFEFSQPYFYDGLRYAGIPPFAACADNLDYLSPECVDLRLCVNAASTWYQVSRKLFPDSIIVAVSEDTSNQIEFLEQGICNAIAGESTDLFLDQIRTLGFTGADFEIGSNIYSKEPLAAMTREDDPVWSKFVAWVIYALIEAEESGITMSSADSMSPTDVFGPTFRLMFQNAVAANGNYGELYAKNLQDLLPRGGMNDINAGTGLLFPLPLGFAEAVGPEPNTEGALGRIRRRGFLNCGVFPSPGFAVQDPVTSLWSGFEIDFCRGLSAALFNGGINVNFIPVTAAQRFEDLARGTVDLLAARVTHTFAGAIEEKLEFSEAYFYDSLTFLGYFPYGECADQLVFDNVTLSPDCPNTKICVEVATTWLDVMRGRLDIPEENIVTTPSQAVSFAMFESGECNAMAVDYSYLLAVGGADTNSTEDGQSVYYGRRQHSKEPIALASLSGDPQFSDFLRWMIFGFSYASEQGITQDSFFLMPGSINLFGESLSGMWQNAINAVGNYEEVFTRNFAGALPASRNRLNDGNSPQLYAMPGVTEL